MASLDLGQQLAVMRLARGFADAGGGVVAVMHDLNLSAMFADCKAMMIHSRIERVGKPEAVMTADLLRRAYGCRIAMNTPPANGPWFVPQSALAQGEFGQW